ncbi:hypothetical protein DFH09DRAFT_1106106 [Mycena vulgaris]|nr:hypothetical protein DFH09DRAFT_1106106 [Mycena vulgaris]
MDVDTVVAAKSSDDDDIVYYGDDDMEDGVDPLPNGGGSSGSGTPSSDSDSAQTTDAPDLPQVSKVDPMRGGGIVSIEVPTKTGRMCSHRQVRAMALEGDDAVEERKLLQRINEHKWLLNENLYVPECRGETFDPDEAMDAEEFAAASCKKCGDYVKHVGEDYARGDGSLKAVIRLRDMYLVADARIYNKQAEEYIKRLEVANATSEKLDEEKDRRITELKAEKSLAVQEIGRLEMRLINMKDQRDDAWKEIKTLERKNLELDELVQKLAFPEHPHKKGRSTPPASQFVNIVVWAPPMPREPLNVDKRGFPTDVAAMDEILRVLSDGKPYFVYALRVFYMWTFCRAIKHQDRTPVQQRAIDGFIMHDWFANLLTSVSRDEEVQNETIKFFRELKRDELGYNPKLLAQLIQFNEWSDICGCPFADHAWSINMRLVRGLNLMEAMSLSNRNSKDESRRTKRALLEKSFLELFCTPFLYDRMLARGGLHIAATFAPGHWDDADERAITVDTVVQVFAERGVPVALVNDAYEYGQAWVNDWLKKPVVPLQWTADELNALRPKATDTRVPPGINAPVHELFPRRPELPWRMPAEQFLLTQLSHLQHAELAGMKRALGSRIQAAIDRGLPHANPRNLKMLERVNPFMKEIRKREAATAALTPKVQNAVAGSSNGLPPRGHQRTRPYTRGMRTSRPNGYGSSGPTYCPTYPVFPVASAGVNAPEMGASTYMVQVTFPDPHPDSFAANEDDVSHFTAALERAGLATAPPFVNTACGSPDSTSLTDGWAAMRINTDIEI